MNTYFFSLASIIILSPSFVFACNTPSPFGSTPEEYYSELVDTPINEREYKVVKNIFKKMDGQWVGTGVLTECKRIDGVIKEVKDDLRIHFEAEGKSSNLRARSSIVFIKEGKTNSINLVLHLKKPSLRPGANNENSAVQYTSIDSNKFSYLVRLNKVHSGYTKRRVVTDTHTTFVLGKKYLEVTTSSYVMGEFSTLQIWKLRRRSR